MLGARRLAVVALDQRFRCVAATIPARTGLSRLVWQGHIPCFTLMTTIESVLNFQVAGYWPRTKDPKFLNSPARTSQSRVVLLSFGLCLFPRESRANVPECSGTLLFDSLPRVKLLTRAEFVETTHQLRATQFLSRGPNRFRIGHRGLDRF